MRDKPKGWADGAPPIQWLCAALHHFLGLNSFDQVPILMSRFGSVADSEGTLAFSAAAFTLNQLGMDATAPQRVRNLVERGIEWERSNRSKGNYQEPPFILRTDPLSFRIRRGQEKRVREMAEALARGLPDRDDVLPLADIRRPFVFAGKHENDLIQVQLPDSVAPPPPPKHILDRGRRKPIRVSLSELEKVARDMDERDARNPAQPPGNWAARLKEEDGSPMFRLLVPAHDDSGLLDSDYLDLSGLRHMIGLPGSGKTTLVTILLVWLDRKGYRAVVLLPSIEISINLIATLKHYGARASLLSGQSPDSRRRHAARLAQKAATFHPPSGFGGSIAGADLLAQGCALPAFSDRPLEPEAFPIGSPPCTSVYEIGKNRRQDENRRLCPLSGWCGYLKASRDLTSSNIWVGHIKSLDTYVPEPFTRTRIRYFELVARTADLVIVDEADGAQRMLDEDSMQSLSLLGDVDSLGYKIITDVSQKFATGDDQDASGRVEDYEEDESGLRKIGRRLIRLIQGDYEHARSTALGADQRTVSGRSPPPLIEDLARFKNRITTTASALSALCSFDAPEDTENPDVIETKRFGAIWRVWEECIHTAVTHPESTITSSEQLGFDDIRLGELTEGTGLDPHLLGATAVSLSDLLRRWFLGKSGASKRLLPDLQEQIFRLAPPHPDLAEDPKKLSKHVQFLIGISVLSKLLQTLIPTHHEMVMDGVHKQSLFDRGASTDLLRFVPESLAGRFSGIRYNIEEMDKKPTVKLQYVSIRSAPRVLLYRLHHLLRHDGMHAERAGPNVLLTSATSFLKDSPTYNIGIRPHMILKRARTEEEWKRSRYIFRPFRDPDNPELFLRYSGAPLSQRPTILRKMVDVLASPEDGDDVPLLVRLLESFDHGRKIAIVVNSYEQGWIVKQRIDEVMPDLAPRAICVTNTIPNGPPEQWTTPSLVERLGEREADWDVVIFPMKALARGVNIVFENGPRKRDALLGTILFLTRPHPSSDSLELPAGLASSSTLEFDLRGLPPDLPRMQQAWGAAHHTLMPDLHTLLRFPPQMSKLGERLGRKFAANVSVDVLQTIGRAMRNDCRAHIMFIDSAWAPNSLPGMDRRETPTSSLIVMMRDILREMIEHHDPVEAEAARIVYESFLYPLSRCENVRFPEGGDI